MTTIYRLVLEFQPFPVISPLVLGFPEDALTGTITLRVDNAVTYEFSEIMTVKWDYRELVAWFTRNREALIEERLPAFIGWRTSIFESMQQFYRDDDALDAQDDEAFEYRTRHQLNFGLRGLEVAPTYLGRGPNGWEVSGERNGKPFVYRIDLPGFLERFREARAA
ncbi:hypothetical protein [Cupriavidus agavae]|uniref:Uncharacterized protein n=1 Tax=Cupriavidus agavae TaxID=1001822 RepID=A0A4Q7RWM6_9BURK|nr:hypothetical protein [Cupriavidus agavae]RZT38366.1 hypothetical protein EV147_2832 [Cupriavidus agavae]